MERTISPHAGLQSFALDYLHRVIAVTGIRRSGRLEHGGHIRMRRAAAAAGFTQKRSRIARELRAVAGTSITFRATLRCKTLSMAR